MALTLLTRSVNGTHFRFVVATLARAWGSHRYRKIPRSGDRGYLKLVPFTRSVSEGDDKRRFPLFPSLTLRVTGVK